MLKGFGKEMRYYNEIVVLSFRIHRRIDNKKSTKQCLWN